MKYCHFKIIINIHQQSMSMKLFISLIYNQQKYSPSLTSQVSAHAGQVQAFIMSRPKSFLFLIKKKQFYFSLLKKQVRSLVLRSEHKLHSISRLFISQIIQVMFFFLAYVSWALNTRTCIQQGNLKYFILQAYTGTMYQPQPTQEKSGQVLEKVQMNGPDG